MVGFFFLKVQFYDNTNVTPGLLVKQGGIVLLLCAVLVFVIRLYSVKGWGIQLLKVCQVCK